MNVRWMSVIIGFVFDFFVSEFILVFSPASFLEAPDLQQPSHVVIFVLQMLSTGAGGYVAARLAGRQRALHGLLVGVVGVLFNQIPIMMGAAAPTHLFVIGSLIACVLGACGGFLSRFPAPVTLRS